MSIKFLIFLGTNFHSKILRIEQYLPRHLAKYGEVYCFEYPKFTKIFEILFKRLPLIEKISSKITVFHSFGFLPFGRSLYLINNFNHIINFSLLKYLLRNNFYNVKIISFTPEIAYLLRHFTSNNNIFYYVIDNYTSLPFWSNSLQKKQFKLLEKKTLKSVKKVITASEGLYNKYKKLHKNVVYFPSPADLSIYNNYTKSANKIILPDIQNIPKPIIGFIGAFQDWRIDTDLIIKICKKFATASIVSIGTFETSNKKMKELKNFYFLGYKNHSVIPAYLASFNACIIPYRIDNYGKFAYPVKLIEYLYMAKPIVTTALPAIKELGNKNLIYISKDHHSFLKMLKQALIENIKPSVNKKRITYALNCSWENQIINFLNIINDK